MLFLEGVIYLVGEVNFTAQKTKNRYFYIILLIYFFKIFNKNTLEGD